LKSAAVAAALVIVEFVDEPECPWKFARMIE
jgi:hypothetical protein